MPSFDRRRGRVRLGLALERPPSAALPRSEPLFSAKRRRSFLPDLPRTARPRPPRRRRLLPKQMRRLPPGGKAPACQDLRCAEATGLRRLPHAAGDRRSEHGLQKSLDRNLPERRRAEAVAVNAMLRCAPGWNFLRLGLPKCGVLDAPRIFLPDVPPLNIEFSTATCDPVNTV